jgi:hypothetical protein
MQLHVITKDGRRGEVATELLKASAFKPVIVQFPEGDRKPYYLRELRIDDRREQRKQPA